ncbi:AAA family ATPase [Flavobacterium lindanitolerans]|jgi:predicted ATP-dependent endonuclease of OLD family|uniref:AAA family ATPase n=1 Tax=Flavobacterium lindanitolerans TaxID=428988 RepID=UPI0023F528AD|nr:AAA family ATPase [Flavobacterium lindanitolerans]
MEKLIVKNFGPIKEAEIELTKYVVFIGDTSTGKSVLAKLISIFRDANFIFQNQGVKKFKELLVYYNIDFNFENSTFDYYFGDYRFKFLNNEFTLLIGDNIIEEKNKLYSDRDNDIVKIFSSINSNIDSIKANADNKDLIQSIENFLLKIKSTPLKQTVYFPAERSLISVVGESISGLWANNVALPNYFKNFSANYEMARKYKLHKQYSDFGFEYKFENGEDKIVYAGQQIFLNQASSGMQSLVPLLLVFDFFLNAESYKLIKSILIEEPELNLFPKRQKVLVDYIVNGINKSEDSLVITTHSPYILSVLDTLILAKNTFNEHPDLRKEINSIIPKSNWIDYNDISVYEVRDDGKVYSIKNEEFKSIDTNAIDGASDVISEEFDKLTELRYAQ